MSPPHPVLFAALRRILRGGYSWKHLRGDLSAGLTVGIIAIPLAMALAIAVGVAPQHGLYTVLVAGALLSLLLESIGLPVATLGERFSYSLDGVEHAGIPPFLPSFTWPWQLPGADGQPLQMSFELVRQLLAPALTIAMLGRSNRYSARWSPTA